MDFSPTRRLQSRLAATSSDTLTELTQPIPVYVSLTKKYNRRKFASCSFEGFYEPELMRGRRFIWSSGEATVRCRFPDRTIVGFVFLEIACTAPRGNTVEVLVNKQSCGHVKRVRGRSTLCIRLPSVQECSGLDITIRSDTFVPTSAASQVTDSRQLGIGIRGMTFARKRNRYRPAMDFEPRLADRVRRACRSLIKRRAA